MHYMLLVFAAFAFWLDGFGLGLYLGKNVKVRGLNKQLKRRVMWKLISDKLIILLMLTVVLITVSGCAKTPVVVVATGTKIYPSASEINQISCQTAAQIRIMNQQQEYNK